MAEQQSSTAGTSQNADIKWPVALFLSSIAGLVDAIGFLSLFRIFTAHMSGNSVSIGAYFAQGEWPEVIRHTVPIPFFVLGIAAGAVTVEIANRHDIRRAFSLATLLELVLLLGFTFYAIPLVHGYSIKITEFLQACLLSGLLAMAMGVQTAALRHIYGQTVHTTYISGVLTNGTTDVVDYAFWLYDQRKLKRALLPLPHHPARDRAGLRFLLWLLYVLGAIVGGETITHWGMPALALPLGGLACLIMLDTVRPIYSP
jgi:uncharacterized membrane protein YoaK (UPF0700 family)